NDAGTTAADAILVNAAALADDTLLTLTGSSSANFTVSNLIGNLNADALAGALTVTTGAVAGLSIATGSGSNTIHADALTNDQVLTLTGDDAATVTLTAGDLNAATDSGVLTVTVATDTAGSTNTITTGSNAITINDAGTTAADAILVNAAALADDTLLTLTGSSSANFTVSNLIGNLNADALAGALTVTTGAVAGLSIATGSGSNTIHADALTNDQVLTLTGDDAATVTLTAGDLNAATDSGVLTVTVATDTAGSTNTITTGSNAITINDAGTTAADAILVNAAALADDTLLTLTGSSSANFTVSNLIGNLNADALAGALTVTTGAVAGLSIATGSGSNTIHADALTNDQVLTLTGDDAATVTLTAGDLNAATDSGVLTVTVATDTAGSTNTITTGSNAITINDAGTTAADAILVNAAALADDTLLTLTGSSSANFTVSNLIGNLNADALAGALTVTTGAVAGLSIATGSGSNTIHADALTNDQVLTLTGDDAATVTLTAGDLNAATDSGVLTVTVATDTAGSTNTITTGSNAITINDAAALADDTLLTLTGSSSANFTVSNLIGNLNADALAGALTVTTGAVAGLS